MVQAEVMRKQIEAVAEMFEMLEAGEGGLVDVRTRVVDLTDLLDQVVCLGQIVQEAVGRESLNEVSDRDLERLAVQWMKNVG
jgi:hypothetical protein